MKLRRLLRLIKFELLINSIKDRVLMTFYIAIFVNFFMNLFYIIYGLYQGGAVLMYVIFLICSGIPLYFIYMKQRFKLALILLYFLSIILLTIIAYILLSTKNLHASLENALIPYVAINFIFFKNKTRTIGFIINILPFIYLKFYKYQNNLLGTLEIFEDLAMPLVTYFTIIAVTFFYSNDFELLRQSNIKLNDQKDIIESQAKFLQSANDLKDRLFNIISHDLRGPIISLQGMFYILNKKRSSPENYEILLNRASENIDNIQLLLDNLLLWSAFQIKGDITKPIHFPIKPFLVETIYLYKEALAQKNIEIISDIPSNLSVFIDQQQVRVIFRNILNNAIKFTPENGWIKIDANQTETDVVLKFMDSGIGIKEEELKEIFSSPKLNIGTNGETGSGIGLILSKEMVTNNGGNINIKSQVGKGTTVEVSLPIK